MSDPENMAEAKADIAFLIARADAAGCAYFGSDRWTGLSSNAIVSVAYGGRQTALPHDRGDYAACLRTYRRLPIHRRTLQVKAALNAAREAYLTNYPADRYPAPRAAARAERLAASAAWRAKQKPKRRRRA